MSSFYKLSQVSNSEDMEETDTNWDITGREVKTILPEDYVQYAYV